MTSVQDAGPSPVAPVNWVSGSTVPAWERSKLTYHRRRGAGRDKVIVTRAGGIEVSRDVIAVVGADRDGAIDERRFGFSPGMRN